MTNSRDAEIFAVKYTDLMRLLKFYAIRMFVDLILLEMKILTCVSGYF